MVFSSIPFLFFFFPICLIAYYLVPFKYKNYCLLFFSLLFYAWGEPIYILLMLFSCGINYVLALLIEKNKKNTHQKKTILLASIIINILVIGFFKYSDFLIENINSLFSISIPLLKLGLPIGISFFTFQTMSYVIDVYRGEVKAERSFLTFTTYVSMFPQLIAGPIVRYETVSKELVERKIYFSNFASGMIRFLRGLFKKVLIANNIGALWSIISGMPLSEMSVLTPWLGILAFTLQIYFDFSGYSDMAIGMGKMLGFHFLENFNYPYIAKSITDFWHRWHISLSSWFRDYVYIPLGGSRVKKIINIRNIIIVWALTGLWHGASWNFIIWGIYYGILLILEKFVLKKYIEKWPNWLKHTYTLFLVVIGWMIFAIDDTHLLGEFAKTMFGFNHRPFINNTFTYYFINYFWIFIVGIIFSMPTYDIINKKLKKIKNKKWQIIIAIITIILFILLFLIVISYLVSDSYNPFLYFRF